MVSLAPLSCAFCAPAPSRRSPSLSSLSFALAASLILFRLGPPLLCCFDLRFASLMARVGRCHHELRRRALRPWSAWMSGCQVALPSFFLSRFTRFSDACMARVASRWQEGSGRRRLCFRRLFCHAASRCFRAYFVLGWLLAGSKSALPSASCFFLTCLLKCETVLCSLVCRAFGLRGGGGGGGWRDGLFVGRERMRERDEGFHADFGLSWMHRRAWARRCGAGWGEGERVWRQRRRIRLNLWTGRKGCRCGWAEQPRRAVRRSSLHCVHLELGLCSCRHRHRHVTVASSAQV